MKILIRSKADCTAAWVNSAFETYLEEEEGYQDVIVKSEVLTTTEEYFTLKLLCYQGAGSGYQWNYYYTIDLTTGEKEKWLRCIWVLWNLKFRQKFWKIFENNCFNFEGNSLSSL